MKSLARSARAERDAGEFLSPVFRPLEQAKIRARAGTATMIVGPPGAFKTGFTLYYMLRLGLPTLFFSADCEPFEIVERAAAALSGDPMDDVHRHPDKYTDILNQYGKNLRFVFNDSPSYVDVELEVAAYAEVYGEFPKVIVVDNLMNLTGEQDNEWAGMRDSMRVIHKLTRITKASMFLLHHAADDRNDPTTPAPRSKLQGKVGQLPKAIWSLALAGDELRVAPVKNRWGAADASGQTYVTLYVDPSRNRIHNSRFDMQNGRIA